MGYNGRMGRMLWQLFSFTAFIYAMLSLSFWTLTLFWPGFEEAVGKLSAFLALLVFVGVLVAVSVWYLGARLLTGKWPIMHDVSDDIASINHDISLLKGTTAEILEGLDRTIGTMQTMQKQIVKIERRLARLEKQNEQRGKAKKQDT